MDNSFLVDDLHYLDHLTANKQGSGQIKLLITLLEMILKTLTQLVHNHDMILFAIFSRLVSQAM